MLVKWRPTLGQVFSVAAAAIVVVVLIAFSRFRTESRASIARASETLRESAAHRVEASVAESLGRAKGALENVERAIRTGAVQPGDLASLEVRLFTELTASAGLEEVTFTRANLASYDADGRATFDPAGRFQLAVHRSKTGRIATRLTRRDGDGFVVLEREREADGKFDVGPFVAKGSGIDPTEHPTFSVISMKRNLERAIWSDLHYSELDAGTKDARVVLSIQKAIENSVGEFTGVVRVGLLTTDIDAATRVRVEESNPNDPHRIVLLSLSPSQPGARLVARSSPEDRLAEFNDELRFVPAHPSPDLRALLDSELVRKLDFEHPNAKGTIVADGKQFLATLKELSLATGGTMGWFVAVLVPEAHYTEDLVRFERTFLVGFAVTLLIVCAIGAAALAAVRRGLFRVVRTTSRMRAFDFERESTESVFREVHDVRAGLERAKTVVRAMEKYVPLDLVRRLYERDEEPALGGDLCEVSLLFTDMEGFTSLSERLSPDELARRLGAYLEVMTEAIERTSGTIDKYIGDAVMAFWNAPTKVQRDAERACEAVLACQRAASELFASPSWNGLPPVVTRFGLHRARVMVGHFGAPTRLNYTALGDGVNLAARLEPLCKQYGVTVLASEAIVAEAGSNFVFRRIDRVAVKGKERGVDVYELLGKRGEAISNIAEAERYERAFEAYLARQFVQAEELLRIQHDDPPSLVLSERCRQLGATPPPADWTGVHIAKTK